MESHASGPDPYRVLGIASDAEPGQVRRAYRSLALRHHPDSNPGDAFAGDRFREIRAAYETLCAPSGHPSRTPNRSVREAGGVAEIGEAEMDRILAHLKKGLARTLRGSSGERVVIGVSLGKHCSKSHPDPTENRARRPYPSSGGFVRPVPPQPPQAPRKPR